MKPVFQTDLTAATGNCLQAALASLLELPLEQVPHLGALPDGADWGKALTDWLYPLGISLVFEKWEERCVAAPPGTLCLACGFSPRANELDAPGLQHAIVARVIDQDGKFAVEYVHDPHPSGGFLVGPPTELMFLFKPVVEVAL